MPYLGSSPDTAIDQKDLNGQKLIIDADADTSIHASTDDQIDVEVAGADVFQIKSSSGDAVIRAAVDAKDILFQQYDGRTLLDINDGGYVAIANGATGAGQLRLYEDTDNGTNFTAFQVGTQSADLTYTLPTADGSDGHALKTDGSGTLSWGAVAANTPSSADGQALGSASLEWSDLYIADGGVIYFGNDQEIKVTHSADSGLLLKHTATADDKPINLVLQTGETDMAADDVIGKISFQAPDEGEGTDAVLISAAIQAVAEGDHSSSSNATKLEFMTGASEAAAVKWSIESGGLFRGIDGAGILVGKSGGPAVEFGGSIPTLQVVGTAEADSTIGVGRWSADAVGPRFIGIKSRHASVGSTAIINDGDTLLDIVAYGDDAASDYYEAPGAMIRMAVDGTPGTNDMPGRMTFHTSQDGGQALEERLRINYHGDMCLGDTTNGSTTLGFTVNQAAADNSAFALKSSDVAHGQTSALLTSETDTFFQIEKSNSAYGGSRLGSLAENACTTNMSFHAVGTTPATSPSTSAAASFAFHGRPHNDSNGTANYAANALVFSVVGFVGGTDRRIWFVDEDGDTHADGTHNNTVFDEYDDALVCRSLDLMRSPKNVIKSEFDNWTKDHKKILEDVGVISKLDPSMPEYWDENGNRADPMLNISQLQRLHNGAIWQQRAMFETMKKVVDKMLPGFSEKLNEELEAQSLPALPI